MIPRDKITIASIVPNIPKVMIYSMFLIKFFFLRVNPAENMIGGKINKKKPVLEKLIV
jgi:hypothetical protein